MNPLALSYTFYQVSERGLLNILQTVVQQDSFIVQHTVQTKNVLSPIQSKLLSATRNGCRAAHGHSFCLSLAICSILVCSGTGVYEWHTSKTCLLLPVKLV